MAITRHKYRYGSVFLEKTENRIDTAMEQNLQKYISLFTCLLDWNKKINHYNKGYKLMPWMSELS